MKVTVQEYQTKCQSDMSLFLETEWTGRKNPKCNKKHFLETPRIINKNISRKK